MAQTESTLAVAAARDQSMFREVNERLRDLNETFESITRDSEFICECANRDCVEHVSMTLAEYERIRSVPTHFLVVADDSHVFPDVEHVIDANGSHFVVEKVGDAGAAAIRLDPRSRHGHSD